jgi:hypothetical protein
MFACTAKIQQIQDLPKQKYQDVGAKFPNFEYV